MGFKERSGRRRLIECGEKRGAVQRGAVYGQDVGDTGNEEKWRILQLREMKREERAERPWVE